MIRSAVPRRSRRQCSFETEGSRIEPSQSAAEPRVNRFTLAESGHSLALPKICSAVTTSRPSMYTPRCDSGNVRVFNGGSVETFFGAVAEAFLSAD